jgi:hypothetical protein
MSVAMLLLHATDIRQVALILRFGLFTGRGRSPFVAWDAAGRAYVERIIRGQGGKGWAMGLVAFEVGSDRARRAEDPAGVGIEVMPAVAEARPALPPELLRALEAVEPQGPGIARMFREWEREAALVYVPASAIERARTCAENARLVARGLMSAGDLARLENGLTG